MWTPALDWEGALVAFLTFNAVKGVDMLMWAFVSIHDGRPSTPGEDAQAEGKGYIMNYFIQLLLTTGAGGYVWRERTKSKFEVTLLDLALALLIATILLWDKVFPHSPLLHQSCTIVMKAVCSQDVARTSGTQDVGKAKS